MTIIKSVLENLEWGRNFLRNSQLRSLRNLSWMNGETQDTVLDNIDISIAESLIILRWLDLCNGRADVNSVWSFWMFYGLSEEPSDDYLYCYTPQLELTQLGQRMKDETYQAQARA